MEYIGEKNSKGKPNAHGTMTYADGGRYSGEFKDGKRVPCRRAYGVGSSSDNITGPGSSAKASGARDACGGTDVVLEGVAEAVPAAQHPVGGGLHGG